MKKLIFISLLAIPFCRATDTDYYREAQTAASFRKWQKVYELIDEGKVDVNEIRGKYDLLINDTITYNDLGATQELLNRGTDLNIATWMTPLQQASSRYISFRDNMPLIQLLFRIGGRSQCKKFYGAQYL